MSYSIKLDVFEGPLDLLLFFIKRDEINIYDIPISYITKEYLEYLDMMKSMNLHLAGDFLLIAAMLMRIKIKMLLPAEKKDDDEEIEDPRTELVDMLLEYQKYKEISGFLREMETSQSKYYNLNIASEDKAVDPNIFLTDIALQDISIMFKKLIDKMPKLTDYEVKKISININQQIQFIKSFFSGRKRVKFSEISTQLKDKIEVVVTFLAILELVMSRQYSISQKNLFGDIWLSSLADKK